MACGDWNTQTHPLGYSSQTTNKMAVTTTKTNKPLNPRGNDQSPKGYNRAALYSGKALDFDGVNDSVTISDNTAVDFGTSDFSIAFIMQSDTAGYGRLIDKRSGTSGYTLSVGTSKELVLELNNGAGSAGFFTSSVYADGKLKHVVISADRDGNASFYINGVLDETIDISSKAGNLDSTSDLFIGADAPSGVGLYYNGLIAGVKMYSTALTAAQVADLYNNPEKVVPTGVDNTALKLWLPMMEGAGTTAYDGSGNGNHGTISGGTYVNGVGAPVSQSAVMDWNKGVNRIINSENFIGTGWSSANATITSNAALAPNGTMTADRIQLAGSGAYVFQPNVPTPIGSVKLSGWFKGNTAQTIGFNNGNDVLNSINITTEWAYYELIYNKTSGATSAIQMDNYFGVTPTNQPKDFYAWGLQLREESAGDVYIPTFATAQPTPVLLPQGLTTGRDITGVNLFENVRKQGALNLDGNSWAEVHDNASLDITTAITLEAWVKCGDELDAIYNHIFVKQSGVSWAPPYGVYTLRLRETSIQWWFNSYTSNKDYSVSLSGWNHLAVTKNGTSEILYLNGVQVDTNTGASSIAASDYSLLIGSRTGHSAAEMVANQLAQPRIYNRALTAEEVLRNYNSGKNTYK